MNPDNHDEEQKNGVGLNEKIRLYRQRIIDIVGTIDDTWLLNLIFDSIVQVTKD